LQVLIHTHDKSVTEEKSEEGRKEKKNREVGREKRKQYGEKGVKFRV
jgi:hypothetical protein